MLVCFTSDLHGDADAYGRLGRLLRAQRPEVLILGGDLLADGDTDDPVGTQVAYLHEVMMNRLDAWRAELPGLTIACIVGNHEWRCSWDALQALHDAGRIVLLDHRRVWLCDRLAFVGYSKTPPTPFHVKDFERLDLPDDALPGAGGFVWDSEARCVRHLSQAEHFGRQPALAADLENVVGVDGPWIFVCHCPPHNTMLDRLPHVDYPVGSRAVRRFIEQRRPLLSLHGHIHESPEVTGSFIDRLGPTVCANPGQGHERVHALFFDTRDPVGTLRRTVFA